MLDLYFPAYNRRRKIDLSPLSHCRSVKQVSLTARTPLIAIDICEHMKLTSSTLQAQQVDDQVIKAIEGNGGIESLCFHSISINGTQLSSLKNMACLKRVSFFNCIPVKNDQDTFDFQPTKPFGGSFDDSYDLQLSQEATNW